MISWPRLLLIPLAFGVLIAGRAGEVHAQIGPNQLPQTGVPEPRSSKPDGVAEQAKEGPDKLPSVPVMPQPKSRRKRFELFELDGYYRFRTDWMKNLHMGFDDLGAGGAPFPRPLQCASLGAGCGAETLKSANMRLRLEPTINIDETTQIFLQVDMLDNVVLGSTPDSLAARGSAGNVSLGAFSGNQDPPQAGTNHATDSVHIRRAWAEVETPLGHLTFGRQPWHWGAGIFANAGDADPFSGTYDMDDDYGDTVDRLMFRAQVPGTRFDAAIAMDWSLTYPSAAHDALYAARAGGQPWDLEDSDDVNQWVFMITRFDTPQIFAEDMAAGELAINYGGLLVYRTQDNDTRVPTEGETFGSTIHGRGLKTYTPDAWVKLGLGKLTVEFEGVATFGEIGNVSDISLREYPADANDPDATETVDGAVSIRRLGAVARVGYKGLEDKLHLGFEVGFASGDQWDNEPAGSLHFRDARPLAVGGDDTVVENFLFNPAYQVDMLLFRELMGTVTNATYAKPSLSYRLTREFAFQVQGILSFANVAVATPGNSTAYGAELNGDISYRAGGFYAGIAYGVLFPFGALNHPSDTGAGGPGYGFGANAGDAGTAQTIQTRLMLRF